MRYRTCILQLQFRVNRMSPAEQVIKVLKIVFTTALLVGIFVLGSKAQNVEVSGTWVVTSSTNPMDSVRTVSALQDSVETPPATLVIRCKAKHAEVYVNAHDVVSVENGVRIKFDEGGPVRQSLATSSKSRCLILAFHR
jgi:hypothetical protein